MRVVQVRMKKIITADGGTAGTGGIKWNGMHGLSRIRVAGPAVNRRTKVRDRAGPQSARLPQASVGDTQVVIGGHSAFNERVQLGIIKGLPPRDD